MISYKLSDEVAWALSVQQPVVALESTVITHGLPFPENLSLAQEMETVVRENGCQPATIAVLDGEVLVGLNTAQLERLSRDAQMRKISSRDLAPAIALHWSGGTTVAGTLAVAHMVGLKVFATGGIGGVHRRLLDVHQVAPESRLDVSSDLTALAHTPIVVVCAGAKAILDLPATFEVLETLGVPVIGYQTNDVPAFYSYSSGLSVSVRVDTPEQAAEIARTHWMIGQHSAVLVTVPPPDDVAMPPDLVNQLIVQALAEAQEKRIHGQGVTPFLLQRMAELSGGASLKANLALLRNNARIAAWIAKQL